MEFASENYLVIGMFVTFIALLFTGFPVAFVLAGVGNYVDALHWTAMLMADPECVITNKKNDMRK